MPRLHVFLLFLIHFEKSPIFKQLPRYKSYKPFPILKFSSYTPSQDKNTGGKMNTQSFKTIHFCFVLFIFNIGNFANASLKDRVQKARSICLNSNNNYFNEASFHPPHHSDFDLYTPSTTQNILSPVYIGIFDRFGGVIQGMIENDDAKNVPYYLKKLGQEAKRFFYHKRLNKLGATCLASCITNQLMEGDEDVFPTTSLSLAISNGKGFCRHFALSTLEILKNMGIYVKPEYSFRHMFLKLNHGRQKLYFDPSINEGTFRCNFIKANDIKK